MPAGMDHSRGATTRLSARSKAFGGAQPLSLAKPPLYLQSTPLSLFRRRKLDDPFLQEFVNKRPQFLIELLGGDFVFGLELTFDLLQASQLIDQLQDSARCKVKPVVVCLGIPPKDQDSFTMALIMHHFGYSKRLASHSSIVTFSNSS